MDMKKILQALDGASSKPVEGSNDMKHFMQIVEGKGPLNRLTQSESIVMQDATPKKKTITNPVLNVSEDAKPSMFGKYFKTVQEELLEAEERHKERASQLAQRVIERVTIGPDGKMSPSFADQMRAQDATPTPEPASSAPMPGKDLPRAEKADKEAKTVTVDGQEYKMVMLPPGGIRPRVNGQRIAIPQAVMGERGIGNYIGILAGSTVYVLPMGEKESIQEQYTYKDIAEMARLGFTNEEIQSKVGFNLSEKCWDTHKQIGMKKKGGRMVPNCVPKESTQKKGPAGQLKSTDKVDVKGTVLGSKEKSQKGLRNKLVGGGS